MLDILRSELNGLSTAEFSEADWQGILDAARRHGVGPLLFHTIRKSGPDIRVPPAVLDKLRRAFLATAVSNARRFHFLSEIAAAFNARSIPLILLKGAHLAQFIYPDPGFRPMSDLDLLVQRSDLNRAADCLFQLGYGFRDYGTGRIGPGKTDHYPIPSDQIHFRALHHRTADIMVELHCAITHADSPFTIDMDGIWNGSRSVRMGKAEARLMHPEDLLLHLCLHLAYQHGFDAASLRALYDMVAVLDGSAAAIDAERVVSRARAWRVHRPFFMCLHLVHRLLKAATAEALLVKARAGDIDEMRATAVLHGLFADRDQSEAPPPYLPGLKEAGGLKGRIRYFFRALFPAKEIVGVRYLVPPTSCRVYLFYLVRIIDFVRDHAREVWRVLRKDHAMAAAMARKIEEDRLRDWLEDR